MFVVERLRKDRFNIRIHARGDSGFGVPWMYQTCEKHRLSYTFGIPGNTRLQAAGQPLLQKAVRRYRQTGRKQRFFTAFSYQAQSWLRARTLVAKAERHDRGTNLRFVVTNLPVRSLRDAQRIYDEYVQRGSSEQRMDELKNGLHLDRLSCHRFLANFWRLLLHTAAVNLLNALRDPDLIPAEWRRARPATWRSRSIKVAATVVQTTCRVVIQLAAQWPYWSSHQAVLGRACALPNGP